MHRTALTGATIGTLGLVAAAGLVAGPLSPPAGPVAPTYKTLTEIEPRIAIGPSTTPGDANSVYRITQPGSYYLTGNVAGSAGRKGIEVAASNVTIDLNGFVLQGAAGSLSGIDLDDAGTLGVTDGVVVRNGTIRGWGDSGVRGQFADRCQFEDLAVWSNTGYGILINSFSVIRGCTISNNTLDGVLGSDNVYVFDSVAKSNRNGFSLATNSRAQNCHTNNSQGSGFVFLNGGVIRGCISGGDAVNGIQGGDAMIVEDCRVEGAQGTGAAGRGILVGQASVVRGCAALGNNYGIEAGATSAVENCSAYSNAGVGIYCVSGTVTNCTARLNGIDGFVVVSGAIIRGCSATANVDDGIAAGTGCTVVDCTASANGNDGIVVNGDCRVRGNNCDGNGATTANGAGIHLVLAGIPVPSVADCRVEENNCTDADFGILVDGAGNVIMRNTCSGNTTNYSIVASNSVGQVLVVSGSTITTTNSFANFEY